MLFRVAIHRWVRHIARAVLPAPRPRVSREAKALAVKYGAAPVDAQQLIDALGAERAEVSLLIARTFNVDPRSVAERVKA